MGGGAPRGAGGRRGAGPRRWLGRVRGEGPRLAHMGGTVVSPPLRARGQCQPPAGQLRTLPGRARGAASGGGLRASSRSPPFPSAPAAPSMRSIEAKGPGATRSAVARALAPLGSVPLGQDPGPLPVPHSVTDNQRSPRLRAPGDAPSSPPALAVPREPGKPYGPLTATRKLTARVLQNLFQ